MPGLFRDVDLDLVARQGGWADYQQLLVLRFLQQAFPHLSPEFKALAMAPDRKDLRLVALAQHYGLPTRLLDWSRSALASLYFAVEGSTGSAEPDSVVFEIEPALFLGPDHGFHDIPFANEILDPPLFDERIAAQKGCFTVFPFPAKDEQPKHFFELGTQPLSARKFIVPGHTRYGVLRELFALGLDEQSVYPGLESAARSAWRSRTIIERVRW